MFDMNPKIEIHDKAFTSDDYISNGELKPWRVRIRLVRAKYQDSYEERMSGIRNFEAEINISDSAYTFTDAVADALRGKTFFRSIAGNRGTIFLATRDKKFRAPKKFVHVEEIVENKS